MIIRICKHCEQPYETFPSVRLHYCCKRCASEGKRRGVAISCVECGKPTYKHASKPNKRFCSISCAISARNKTDANPSYHRDITGAKNPMYGKGRHGPENPMYGKRRDKCSHWKGGRKIRKDGYVVVAVPDDYPNPSDSSHNGVLYALEHRVLMEQHIGRYLDPCEVVHHKDNNPANNAIGNLQLFANQAEHMRHGHPSSPPSGDD